MSARRWAAWLITGLAACSWATVVSGGIFSRDPGPVSGNVTRAELTNAIEALRTTYLRSQEQFQTAQLALLERSRKDAEAAATQNAQAVTAKLAALEQALKARPAPGMETVRDPNSPWLLAAGVLAGIGLLAILLTACFQWRTVNRLAGIIEALALRSPFGAGRAAVAAGTERGDQKMEQSVEQPLSPSSTSGQPQGGAGAFGWSGQAAQVARLLGKGRSLLQLDHPENTLGCLNALACFEEVLALDPHNVEALLKQGAALERLDRLDEAIACYDRAIAVDGSLTVAYLHKAGVFNRLGRQDAALECYQQALHAQEKSRAA